MRTLTPAVTGLLVVNIAVFLAGIALRNGQEHLIDVAALWYPANEHFSVWQLVTYMFLHAGPGHIFFNMFALFSFGTILERQWGAARFLVFYFLCGIGAGLVQLGVNWYEYAGLQAQLAKAGVTPDALAAMLRTGTGHLRANPALQQELQPLLIALYRIYIAPTLGASGAIYGLLVAFGCVYPNAKLAMMFIPVPVAAKIFIPVLIGLDLLSGFTGISIFGAGVAHFAHVGGAAIGFLLMLLWRRRTPPPFAAVGV